MTRRLILAFIVLLAGHSAYAQPGDWSYGDRRQGVHLRVLRDYDLPAGATSQEPIVVLGGTATIDGTVDDDVVVIGGTVRVGPTAVIRGDVVSMGGTTSIDPAARISGRVNETTIMGPDYDVAIGPLIGGWWPAFAFGATLLRLFVVLIVALVLTVVAPTWIQSIRLRAASPLTSAGIGVAGEVLFVPAAVVITIALVVSVIGILLLLAFPFMIGAAALLWVAGFTAVAINIGARLRGRDVESSRPHVLDLLIGFTVITCVTLVAQSVTLAPGSLGPVTWAMRGAGWLIEWLAWTIGLGAALMALLGGRQPMTPPPLPFAPATTRL